MSGHDFVIIDIGTNDLAAGVQPLSVAVKVVDFAIYCIEFPQLKMLEYVRQFCEIG